MKISLSPLIFLVACAALSTPLSYSDDAVDARFLLKDLSGTAVAPLDPAGKKAVVLFFISPYCPTSNTFAPEMVAIAKDFHEDFAFRYIHADPSVSEADRKQHAEMMELVDPVLDDYQQALAKHFGAKTTPETVVVSPEGKVLYQGRINDLYLAPTKRQREVKTHDLRDALTSIRSGKPVPNPSVEAVGCKIPYRTAQ